MNSHMFWMNFLTQIFCFEIITEIATESLLTTKSRNCLTEMCIRSWGWSQV